MIEIVNADCIQYLKALPQIPSISLLPLLHIIAVCRIVHIAIRVLGRNTFHGVAIGFLCCIESVDAAEGLL